MRRPRYEQHILAIAWIVLARSNSGASAKSDDSAAGTTPSSTDLFLDYPDCVGYRPHINDSYCDEANNNAECAYDGGDCCICTCIDGLLNSCGEGGGGYDCQDPDVPDDCGVTPSPAASYGYPDCTGAMHKLENGNCTDELNSAECGYDGGDCCRCTCRNYTPYDDDFWYNYCDSGSFDCQDPSAPQDCVLATDSPTPSPTGAYSEYPGCFGTISYISDGYCDSANNNAACEYDGGDCCVCTCVDSLDFTCGDFDCLDPDADCATTTSADDADYSSVNDDDDDDACPYRQFLASGYCALRSTHLSATMTEAIAVCAPVSTVTTSAV